MSAALASRLIHPRWIPWADRRGQFVTLKLLAFLAGLLPALVLVWQAQAGQLGSRPLNAAIHVTGEWAIRFLLISLAISPLRMLTQNVRVMTLRRQFGLVALAYAAVHLSLYVWDQNLDLLHVGSEIIHRIYLLIGFTALVGLIVLGVTSVDSLIQRLGPRWKPLHRIVFAVAVLGLLHHFMQAKADVSAATLVAGMFFWLMMVRRIPRAWCTSPVAFLLIALLAAAATMGVEFAWYSVATHIDASRVFMTNFSVRFGIRPAVWVGMVGLGIAAFVAVRRLVSRNPKQRPRTSGSRTIRGVETTATPQG